MSYYSVVHRLVPRDSDKYSSLSANLISARMAMTPERYTLVWTNRIAPLWYCICGVWIFCFNDRHYEPYG